MDIWTAPIGAHLDLGPTSAGLDAVARIANRLPGVLVDLTWRPPPEPGRLRLTLVERDPRGEALLRLHSTDPAGNRSMVADLRYRRRSRVPAPDDGLLSTPVSPGDRFERPFTVTEAMLTDHVPDRSPVLTTPDLIGQLEDVAARVLRPRMASRVSSLGTWIGIRHLGAAYLKDTVDVTAIVADVRGRRIRFDVRATVDGRAIGDGQVEQTLIRVD